MSQKPNQERSLMTPKHNQAGELIQKLAQQHITVRPTRKGLALHGPVGGLTVDLLKAVRKDEEAILAVLWLDTDTPYGPNYLRDQRRERVAELSRQGHSTSAIAEMLGISQSQAHRDVQWAIRADNLARPARVRGLNGRSYPATLSRRLIEGD